MQKFSTDLHGGNKQMPLTLNSSFKEILKFRITQINDI